MRDAGFATERTPVASRAALVARRSDFRWRWVATRLHVFVVAIQVTEAHVDLADDLIDAAQRHAIAHKGGLPRGLQTGTATMTVLLTEAPSPALRAHFAQRPEHRFAAMNFPVLLETDRATLTYFTGSQLLGRMYAGHLRRLADDVLAPAADRSAGQVPASA